MNMCVYNWYDNLDVALKIQSRGMTSISYLSFDLLIIAKKVVVSITLTTAF